MNNGINISLLLPTRGRPALLQRLFNSVVDTTANIRELELVLYIDEDDLPTREVSHPFLQLKKLIKPPGQRMGSMNQFCYEESRGRYVLLMNDDVVFRTKAWDARVSETFAQFVDDIALVYGNDLYQREALPTIPVLSRRVCEIIGGVCPRDYFNTYIDLHLFDVFKKLAKLGYPRIVYLEDVIFEHMHHEANKGVMDATYVKKNERADDLLFITLEDERWNQAKMLRRYIEEKHVGTQDGGTLAQGSKQISSKSRFRPKLLLKRLLGSLLSRTRELDS